MSRLRGLVVIFVGCLAGLCRSWSPLICVVVRTYWGHGGNGDGSLKVLLESLQAQSHSNWEAILMVMDQKPFHDLHHIVRNMSDDRIWIFAEWIGSKYTPKQPDGSQWMLGYHNRLYNLTDQAIRVCPSHSEWILVTNGDNLYATNLFQKVVASDADLVALDYYSRYQRATGVPCERFAAEEGKPSCKVNHLQWCLTDLGANFMRVRKLVLDGWKFGVLDDSGRFTGQDGIMAQKLVEAGWKVQHYNHSCLFDHAPSPQRCARNGNIWDDSKANSHEVVGGRCMDPEAAQEYLTKYNDTMEMIQIEVSHDENIQYFNDGDYRNTTLKCIRMKGEEHRQDLMRFYGPQCADDFDKAVFEGADWQITSQGYQPKIITYRNKFPDPPARNSTKKASYRKRYYGTHDNVGQPIWSKSDS
eukprot:TRINITY_DN16639_c1_g2_i1.p1 TRINITY_DN16639_c1_g2~~TRINITY_DN16639_c1_g2_i1.p1  ORF type:complete len:415 (+),score=54.24 TRINITY_DN16639_c1_g2_i1:48-1292(+)